MDAALLVLAILGAIFASFIGVLVERAHTGGSWVGDRSRCNSCSATLGLLDLVPIASWLSTYGRCGHCGVRLPATYLVSEIALAGLFALAYATQGLGLPLLIFLLALCVLLYIVLYDLRHTVVPMQAALILLALSILFAYLTAFDAGAFGLTLMFAGVIGLMFFLLYALGRGRLMGLGDSPIALSLSLLVGFSAALPGLIFSFWIGALCGILILVWRRGGPRMGIEVPFVPFLAAGYLLAFFTQWNPLVL
ncbi:MAG TPA: prepilin peptidase [Candidatus Paceibacterota bacterium]|nr:prepilin peptidase [Candidatus Paceibacterota bacterium]